MGAKVRICIHQRPQARRASHCVLIYAFHNKFGLSSHGKLSGASERAGGRLVGGAARRQKHGGQQSNNSRR